MLYLQVYVAVLVMEQRAVSLFQKHNCRNKKSEVRTDLDDQSSTLLIAFVLFCFCVLLTSKVFSRLDAEAQ